MGRRQGWVGLALAAAVLVAGCGGSGGDAGEEDSDTTSAATEVTEAPTTTAAPATTPAPTTTATPTTLQLPTTVAPTTPVPAAATFGRDAIEGDWIALRAVTSDDGYWNMGDKPLPVEYRLYTMACTDDSCGQIDATISYGDGTTNDVPIEFTFDGEALTATDVYQYECLNPAGTAYDGPQTTVSTAQFDLAPVVVDGRLASFTGTYQAHDVQEASAECTAQDVGYAADMVLFREELATPVALTDGAWSGESQQAGEERAIVGCAAGACTFRSPIDDMGPGDVITPIMVDVPFTETSPGVGSGESHESGNCVGDQSGSYVADDVYDVSRYVELRSYEVAGMSVPVLIATAGVMGEPVAGLAPDVAAECAAYSHITTFGGIPTDDPQLVSLG